mgnify:CR=1 FL=1
MAFSQKQLDELDLAYQRTQSGKTGAATANNAGDVANLEYAKSKGWTPSSGSISGTLNTQAPATPVIPSPQVPSATANTSTSPNTYERMLPESQNSLVNFQYALKNTMREAYGNKPTGDILGQYEQAGVPMTTPGAINAAIGKDTSQRAGRIMDVYSSTVDLIKQQEDTRKQAASMGMDIAKNMLSTGFAAQLTGEDFESLKSGNIPTELMQKWGNYIKNAPQEEAAAPKLAVIDDKTMQWDAASNKWVTPYGTENTTTPSTNNGTLQTSDVGIKGNETTGQCGYFAFRKYDSIANGEKMGNPIAEKTKWVQRNGTMGTQGLQVGDLVITNGSDVSRTGNPTQYGHAFIVKSLDENGNITAYESNARGDLTVTDNRQLPINSQAIVGYVRGRLKEGVVQPTTENPVKQKTVEDYQTMLKEVKSRNFNSDYVKWFSDRYNTEGILPDDLSKDYKMWLGNEQPQVINKKVSGSTGDSLNFEDL